MSIRAQLRTDLLHKDMSYSNTNIWVIVYRRIDPHDYGYNYLTLLVRSYKIQTELKQWPTSTRREKMRSGVILGCTMDIITAVIVQCSGTVGKAPVTITVLNILDSRGPLQDQCRPITVQIRLHQHYY